LINLLFLLCVSYAGADNCDYTWLIVNDLDTAGSYDPFTKTVSVGNERINEVLVHEVKHILCELKYTDDYYLDITFCNYMVDLPYMTQSTQSQHYPDRTPRAMSGKMLDTLGLIGEVADFNGRLR